jgi:hypothetical protein
MALTDANHYGNGSLAAGTAGTADDGTGDISNSSRYFSWTRPVKHVMIHVRAAHTDAVLCVKWNAATASATVCDETIVGGQAADYGWGGVTITNPPGINVSKVAIFSAGAATYTTDFYVTGWA